MDETRVPLGQSYRNTGSHHGTFTGEQPNGSSCHQVGTGISPPRIAGNRNARIDPLYRDPQS